MKTRTLGRFIFRLNRIASYAQKASQLMVMFLFFDRVGWSWWLLCLIPIALGIHLVDKHWILPAELEVGLQDNPEWNRTVKQLLEK